MPRRESESTDVPGVGAAVWHSGDHKELSLVSNRTRMLSADGRGDEGVSEQMDAQRQTCRGAEYGHTVTYRPALSPVGQASAQAMGLRQSATDILAHRIPGTGMRRVRLPRAGRATGWHGQDAFARRLRGSVQTSPGRPAACHFNPPRGDCPRHDCPGLHGGRGPSATGQLGRIGGRVAREHAETAHTLMCTYQRVSMCIRRLCYSVIIC